jgi:hypothetical protein
MLLKGNFFEEHGKDILKKKKRVSNVPSSGRKEK